MKPEPLDLDIERRLIKGISKTSTWTTDEVISFVNDVLKTNLNDLKQHIKSACEFWLRYKNNPELLWDERKEYRKQMKELPIMWFDIKIKGDVWFENEDIDVYNEWLFKLAFGDVFKEGDKK